MYCVILPRSDTFMIFFLNDTAPTVIYSYCHPLSLHTALPTCAAAARDQGSAPRNIARQGFGGSRGRPRHGRDDGIRRDAPHGSVVRLDCRRFVHVVQSCPADRKSVV